MQKLSKEVAALLGAPRQLVLR